MTQKRAGLKGFVGYLLIFFMLTPLVYGVNVQVSTNGAGVSEGIKASDKNTIQGSISLSQLGISNAITGTSDLMDSHWVANKDGAYAEVGAGIKGATKPYTYSYTLIPGQGGGKTTSVVTASEDLNVPYASQVSGLC